MSVFDQLYLANLVEAVRSGQCAANTAADWLDRAGATLAEVTMLYANPPGGIDGKGDDCLRGVLAEYARRKIGGEEGLRAERLILAWQLKQDEPHAGWWVFIRKEDQPLFLPERRVARLAIDKSEALLFIKREVLRQCDFMGYMVPRRVTMEGGPPLNNPLMVRPSDLLADSAIAKNLSR